MKIPVKYIMKRCLCNIFLYVIIASTFSLNAQNSCSTSGTAVSGSGDLSMTGGVNYYVAKNTSWSGNLTGSNANVLRINDICSGSSQGSWTGGITETWFPNSSNFRIAVYGIINTSTTWTVNNNRTWYDTIYSSGSQTLGGLIISSSGPNSIVNYGTLTINGDLNITGSITIINKSGGTVHITGSITGSGNPNYDNSGTFTVDGTFNYFGTGNLTNNAGGIINAGTISSNSNGTLTNNGRINVTNNWTSNSTTIINNSYIIIGGTYSGNTNMTWGPSSYFRANIWNSSGNITGPGSSCAALDVTTSWSYSGTVGAGNSGNVYMCLRASPGSGPGGSLNSTQLTCSGCTTLPIELIMLTVEAVNGINYLHWMTAAETNNAYFTIERSKDGVSFEPIGKISGAGNSSKNLRYAFADEKPFEGQNYYRLMQTDFDGKYSFSPVVSSNRTKNLSMNLFPNPNNGTFTIDVRNYRPEDGVLIVMLNILGKEVYFSKVDVSSDTGSANYLTVNNDNISPGVYYVIASSNNYIVKHKLVVSK